MEISFEVNTSTDFTYPGIRKRLPGEPRRKPGPRPTKKPRRYQPRKAPTRLRKDRPLLTIISHDIWENILIFCPLDKLLRLRTLCKSFHSTLSSDRVWKQARLNQFGSGLPDAPQGMKEMDYADLLAAVGCQNPLCGEKCTRRAYWAFRRRWCEKCCSRNVLKERRAREDFESFDVAKTCIPYAMYDSWSHYQWVGHYDSPPAWTGTYGAQTPAYSKFDLQRFDDRYRAFKATSPSREALETWVSEQAEANEEYMKQLQAIEAWVMRDAKDREKDRMVIKAERCEFFKAKAQTLKPPLAAEALELCPSYRKSAEIAKTVTEKSWQILKMKLQSERKQAMAELASQKRRRDRFSYQNFLSDSYDATRARRRGQKSAEQQLVLKLADQVLHDILMDPVGIDERDIIIVILQDVYDMFQRLDDNLKPVTSQGPYQLMMDDARLVYNSRILPLLSHMSDPERRQVAKRVMCPVAQCRNSKDHYFEFESLVQHLRDHQGIAEFSLTDCHGHYLGISDRYVGWYTRVWPRNLPICSPNRQSETVWNADSDVRYQPTIKPGIPLLSDFIETCIKEEHHQIKHDFFSDRVLLAALTLQELPIEQKYKCSLILDYLCWQYTRCKDRSDCLQSPMDSIRLVVLHVGDLFGSQCCAQCQATNPLGVYAMTPFDFADLARHYVDKHMTEQTVHRSQLQLSVNVKVDDDDWKATLTPISGSSEQTDYGYVSDEESMPDAITSIN